MGKVIKGPASWWKNKSAEKTPDPESLKISAALANYPWHTLTAPPGTSDKEYQETLAFLQHLVNLDRDSGGILQLPKGWFWDPKKNQDLINQLLQIADINEDQDDIPDDIA
jgi:hypothetical protein